MLPFTNKEIVDYLKKWGFNEELTDNPLMTKEGIIAWRKKAGADEKAKVFAYTGGSTGQSLKIPLSKRRAAIRKASLLFYNGILGYNLGDNYLFIRAKDRHPVIKKLRNEFVFVPKNISEKEINQLSLLITRKKLKYIFGYPSVIAEIAVFFELNNITYNPVKGIICASEPLYPHQFETMYKVFKCPILDRYGSEEVGVIAHQRTNGGDLLVDRFGLYVEVVDPETLKPVAEGQEGKVVVTDLNADLFPIIRYDTGDTAIVSEYKDGQLYSLKKVLGREIERIYHPDGSPVSSLSLGPGIYKPLSNRGYTCTFQFAQTGQASYELRIKKGAETIEELVINEILSNTASTLGKDARIKVLFVDALSARKSGKVPIYVNEFHKQPIIHHQTT